MTKLFYVIVFTIISNSLMAQLGKITGKIIDEKSGAPISNANVSIEGTNKTVVSDQNGNFTIANLAPGTYNIQCSYVSYNSKIVEGVVVKANEVTVSNISLTANKKTKGEEDVKVVAVRVKAVGETNASLLAIQKNMANTMDGITTEALKKTPAKTASDAIKLVSGASIQDDRFAIIRGLNDRYNAAFINGTPLPSTESDRKAFSFDIFPSAILDNLVIFKTATPDKTGDFAGGIIDISTKATSPKNFTSISFSGGYNSLLTGKNRIFSENKGKKDFFGIDDGLRSIPSGIPANDISSGFTTPQRLEYTKLFENYKWGVKEATTSPNFNFQLTQSYNLQRKEKEFFGALVSVNYSKNFTFFEGDRDIYTQDQTLQLVEINDSVYNEEIIFSALANFSVKINNKNSIAWKNNYSVNTDNRLIKRLSTPDLQGDPTAGLRDIVRSYTSNQILTTQLLGEHQIGSKKTKINWVAALTEVKRDVPNYSRTSYGIDPSAPTVGNAIVNVTPTQLSGSGTMFFVKSSENIKSIKAEVTQPYTFMKNTQNSFKAGGGYQFRDRDFNSRLLGFSPYSGGGVNFDFSLLGLPENQIFLPQNLGRKADGKGGFILREANSPNSNYTASSATTSAFLMNDQRFFDKLRLIYGVRMESFHQKLNSPFSTISTSTLPPLVIDTVVTDFLPSVNAVYAVTKKMNLRASYSETVNRPEFRELAPFVFYDYQAQYSINGDIRIQRAKIKNYDFRYEFFPGKAQLFSASVFYKEFTNPIEIIFNPDLAQQAFYTNIASAEVRGVEVEFRTLVGTLFGIKKEKSFLNKLTISANAALTKSSIQIDTILFIDRYKLITNRPLQGQSPYVINGSINYTDDKSGFSSTISVNRAGDRLSVGGTYILADLYEKGRTVVDFQLAKSFLKNKLEVKFNAKDLLAQDFAFYNDNDLSRTYTDGKDQYFFRYKAPKVFSFAVTYRF